MSTKHTTKPVGTQTKSSTHLPKSTTAKLSSSPGSTISTASNAATTAQAKSEKESDNTDLPTTAIVIGVSTGAIVGQ